jgi:hypothetical protein
LSIPAELGTREVSIVILSDTIVGPLQHQIHRKAAVVTEKGALFIGGRVVMDNLSCGGTDSRYPVDSTIAANGE